MPKHRTRNRLHSEGTDGYKWAAHSPRGKYLLQLKVGWNLPAPMTHVVTVAGAAGNDYPQPQRTGQFRGTQGALDRDPSRVERPHPSLQCHGPPSRSTGARDRTTREGRLSGKHSFWKHVPYPPGFPSIGWARLLPALMVEAGLQSPPQRAPRTVPTSTHYLERESYVDGNRSSDCAQA